MRLKLGTVLVVLFLSSLSAQSQAPTDFTRVYGTDDAQFPTPTHSARSGQDPQAIQQIIDFLKATHIQGWRGLVGTGTITIAGDNTPHPARLSILDSRSYRLDLTKDDGIESTLVSGSQGVFSAPNKAPWTMSSDLAVDGLLTLPRFLSNAYPLVTSSVLDDGTLSAAGVILHRITFDDASPMPDACSPWKTIDLYFNSGTNLLAATAANARVASSDLSCYFLLTQYADYQTVAGSSFPFLISQSINGQLQWSLQLSSVTLTPPSDTTIFTF